MDPTTGRERYAAAVCPGVPPGWNVERRLARRAQRHQHKECLNPHPTAHPRTLAPGTDSPGESTDMSVHGVRDNARIGQRRDLPDNLNSNPETPATQ
jgi:hypothetical protein